MQLQHFLFFSSLFAQRGTKKQKPDYRRGESNYEVDIAVLTCFSCADWKVTGGWNIVTREHIACLLIAHTHSYTSIKAQFYPQDPFCCCCYCCHMDGFLANLKPTCT